MNFGLLQKIKRKIGRKLPPPKNSTSTEIKSKGIEDKSLLNIIVLFQ